jgi:hypothetical protein
VEDIAEEVVVMCRSFVVFSKVDFLFGKVNQLLECCAQLGRTFHYVEIRPTDP